MERNGICVAGNLIVDISYPISAYPSPGQLVTVLDNKTMTVGGLACSEGIDLARLDGAAKAGPLGGLDGMAIALPRVGFAEKYFPGYVLKP